MRAFPRLACARLGQARTGDLQKQCCTNGQNGDDAAFDEVKYIVANEDSFYYALHTRQEVRNALASRGVYEFKDMPKFSLQPKNAAGLGVDPAASRMPRVWQGSEAVNVERSQKSRGEA